MRRSGAPLRRSPAAGLISEPPADESISEGLAGIVSPAEANHPCVGAVSLSDELRIEGGR